MTDWTAGYVVDVGYTYGYYSELNPLRVKMAFLNQGLVCPEFGAACELGFGQGLSTNIHASATVMHWQGTDFNPSQAGFARELSAAAGTDAHLYDDAFADFANRSDLPDFDYIGLHGIWSWISDENRQIIVDFIRKKLKVGGVLYISYNTLPGWAAFAPMRHLMNEHAELMGVEGRGIVNRIDGAIEFAEKLMATNPLFSRANPLVDDRLKQLQGHVRHYLAHEYFNRDWHPMYFSTMGKWLAGAKVQYACSANYLDHIDTVNLTTEQQDFLKEIPDPMFRETARDFMVNQQFRKDYWVKGARKMNMLEQTEALRALRVLLTTAAVDISLKVTGGLGEATLTESIYSPIIHLLSNHQVRSLGEIERAVEHHGITYAQTVQAVMLLSSAGHLVLVQDDAVVNQVKDKTKNLNKYLCQKARGSSDINYLASPVSGGGVMVGRFEQLFLLALSQGKNSLDDLVQFVWMVFAAQKQKLRKEGKTLETEAENLAELAEQAKVFIEKKLPILKALQIA